MSTDRGKRAKYEWSRIRNEYVTSPEGREEVSILDLVERYGHGAKRFKRRIEERSTRENWVKLRDEYRGEIAVKQRKKDIETALQRRERRVQTLRIIQSAGIKSILDGSVTPSPSNVIEACKQEGLLDGEVSEHIAITDHDKRMARAYCKAYREVKEQESNGGR